MMSEEEQKEVFMLFDKMGDDHIESADLGLVLRAMGNNPLETEIMKITKELDPTGNQRVSFPALYPYLKRSSINAPGDANDFMEGLR
eukprot:Ihof_evm2s492 gene=Ihof_evmTU2s492